jgi:hypothetical protein
MDYGFTCGAQCRCLPSRDMYTFQGTAAYAADNSSAAQKCAAAKGQAGCWALYVKNDPLKACAWKSPENVEAGSKVKAMQEVAHCHNASTLSMLPDNMGNRLSKQCIGNTYMPRVGCVEKTCDLNLLWAAQYEGAGCIGWDYFIDNCLWICVFYAIAHITFKIVDVFERLGCCEIDLKRLSIIRKLMMSDYKLTTVGLAWQFFLISLTIVTLGYHISLNQIHVLHVDSAHQGLIPVDSTQDWGTASIHWINFSVFADLVFLFYSLILIADSEVGRKAEFLHTGEMLSNIISSSSDIVFQVSD